MIVSLRLQNFRSYTDASFEFEPGVNIVVGPNAAGKTNLLEAVLVLASGSSYRVEDVELIQKSKDWARLDGFIGDQQRSVKILNKESILQKLTTIEGREYKRLPEVLAAGVVLFEPNHLSQINRGPKSRRELVDELTIARQPEFKRTINNYLRALAQRNRLLKTKNIKNDEIFVWDLRLSELGAQVVLTRVETIDRINKVISKSYGSIANKKSKILLEYKSAQNIENYSSSMLKKLRIDSELDLLRGFTGCGPHREDINFTIDGEMVENTASRGETRSLILALKIFELELVEKTKNQKPIFLLDDVFSELDSSRRRALVDHLKNYQAIITTTDADAVIEYFSAGSHKLISL